MTNLRPPREWSDNRTARSLKEKEVKEARREQAKTFLKNATDAFDEAEEKQAKAGDFTAEDEEDEKAKGGSYNPLEFAQEKKEVGARCTFVDSPSPIAARS